VLDAPAGYYVAGLFLLSTVVRPAVAYLAHLRHRLTVLGGGRPLRTQGARRRI